MSAGMLYTRSRKKPEPSTRIKKKQTRKGGRNRPPESSVRRDYRIELHRLVRLWRGSYTCVCRVCFFDVVISRRTREEPTDDADCKEDFNFCSHHSLATECQRRSSTTRSCLCCDGSARKIRGVLKERVTKTRRTICHSAGRIF